MYGITTKDNFGINSTHMLKNSISYSAHSGYLWDNGISKKGIHPVYDGQVLTLDIDLEKHKISWFVDNKKVAKTTIAEVMQKRDLYLIIELYNVED